MGAAGPLVAPEYFYIGPPPAVFVILLGFRISYLQCISILTGLNLHNLRAKLNRRSSCKILGLQGELPVDAQITTDSMLPLCLLSIRSPVTSVTSHAVIFLLAP